MTLTMQQALLDFYIINLPTRIAATNALDNTLRGLVRLTQAEDNTASSRKQTVHNFHRHRNSELAVPAGCPHNQEGAPHHQKAGSASA